VEEIVSTLRTRMFLGEAKRFFVRLCHSGAYIQKGGRSSQNFGVRYAIAVVFTNVRELRVEGPPNYRLECFIRAKGISLNTGGRKSGHGNPSVLNMGFCQKLPPLKAVMAYMAQSVSTPSTGPETKPRYNVPV